MPANRGPCASKTLTHTFSAHQLRPGVACDSLQNVVGLQLTPNTLTGPLLGALPPAPVMAALSWLKSFELVCGEEGMLDYNYANSTRLCGLDSELPTSWGALRGLEHLTFSGSLRRRGPIPEEWRALRQLRTLRLLL